MSLEKVAQLANVSKATVSRVLNNHDGVSQKKRVQVKSAIKEYGYVSKRGAATTKTRCIGVLSLCRDMFMEQSAAWFDMLHGIEAALNENKYNMLFSQVGRSGSLPAGVLEKRVDGLILSGLHPSEDMLARIDAYPATWITSHSQRGTDHVLVNNEMMGSMAAGHLIGRGHKKLVCIDFFENHPAVSRSCNYFEFEAFRAKCLARRFKCDLPSRLENTIENWTLLQTAAQTAVHRILSEVEPPLGLFVSVGSFIEMIYEALRAAGVVIGRDVDVVGVGCQNSVLSRLSPKPASVDVNAFEIGKRAVEQVLWRIAHPKEPSGISIAVEPMLRTFE